MESFTATTILCGKFHYLYFKDEETDSEILVISQRSQSK